ncbi:peptidylprolyl isomerase [Peristeroidobacter soli]|jgi:peptidyl-prolyl cis-trans isomerase C|uniref:peptidylprolyl isomerase n=1 Tax=Peristeroidobacter soli TaxID=2497877 RepID=UPI00101D0F47|nr:peptidylprolyl isomerase [Peristeroidobacter soli]
MNRHLLVGLLLPLTLLAGCGNAAESQKAPAGPPVAVVNGKNISKSEFDLYVENVGRQSKREISEAEKSQLLDQFISMQLAAEAASKAGIEKQPKVQDQLALARLNVLVDSGLQEWLEKNPVTDAELRPEYDAQVAQMPKEYHARHILVDDQAKAEALTKELKGGADFAKLAEKNSKDPSGKNGGDLGWFTLETMVKPFSDAVAALQPGQMTDQPVQSQFGWHIIKLEESRTTQAPAFDEVKDRVKMLVQRKKLQNYLDELRKNAKIEKKT